MRRSLFLFVIFFAAGYGLFHAGIWRISDGFALAKIQSSLPPTTEKNAAQEIPVTHILKQKFFYMGKGSQCYVFESADKQYVLKFFRHARYRLSRLSDHLILPPFLQEIQAAKLKQKQEKLAALFLSCKIAFEKLRGESGLVYLHLNKTHHLNQTVVLQDRLKRTYYLNIDDYEFLLQRRAEQIYPYLSHLIRDGNRSEAREALSNLARTITHRLEIGISDGDAVIHKNSGFREGQAMFLDVGQFSYDPNLDKTAELKKVTNRLLCWLEERDLALADHFKAATTMPEEAVTN